MKYLFLLVSIFLVIVTLLSPKASELEKKSTKFIDDLVHVNPKAVMRTWADVEPYVALKTLREKSDSTMTRHDLANKVDKWMDRIKNVEEDESLMNILRKSINKKADKFLEKFIGNYPDDLLAVLRTEPKEPFLKELVTSYPHVFLENIFRSYMPNSSSQEDETISEDSFLSYFSDSNPATSIITVLDRIDESVNRQWIQKASNLRKRIKSEDDLRKYLKKHDDKNDKVFKVLRPKLMTAIKKDKKNFFAHVMMFNDILIQTIKNYHSDVYLKTLISKNPQEFRKSLLNIYFLNDNRVEWKAHVPKDEIYRPEAIAKLLRDLLKFKKNQNVILETVNAINGTKFKLDHLMKDINKEYSEVLAIITKNFGKFFLGLSEGAKPVICDYFKDFDQFIKWLTHRRSKPFIDYINKNYLSMKSGTKVNGNNPFIQLFAGEMSEDLMRQLIFIEHGNPFKNAFRKVGLPNEIMVSGMVGIEKNDEKSKLYYKDLIKSLGPKEYRYLLQFKFKKKKQLVLEESNFFYGAIFSQDGPRFVKAAMELHPEAFAKAVSRYDYEKKIACALSKDTPKTFAKDIYPMLLTPKDKFIEHVLSEDRRDPVLKTLMDVSPNEILALLDSNEEETKAKAKTTKENKLTDLAVDGPTLKFRKDGKVNAPLVIAKLKDKVFMRKLLKRYPFFFEEFLEESGNLKLLNKIVAEHPEIYLKYSLIVDAGHWKRKSIDMAKTVNGWLNKNLNLDTLRDRRDSNSAERIRKLTDEELKDLFKKIAKYEGGVFIEAFFKEYDLGKVPLQKNCIFSGKIRSEHWHVAEVKINAKTSCDKLFKN